MHDFFIVRNLDKSIVGEFGSLEAATAARSEGCTIDQIANFRRQTFEFKGQDLAARVNSFVKHIFPVADTNQDVVSVQVYPDTNVLGDIECLAVEVDVDRAKFTITLSVDGHTRIVVATTADEAFEISVEFLCSGAFPDDPIGDYIYDLAVTAQPPPLANNPNLPIAELLEGFGSPRTQRVLEARLDLGLQKYGTLLKVYDGRDTIADALQEAGDLIYYITKMDFERAGEEPWNDADIAVLDVLGELLFHAETQVSVMLYEVRCDAAKARDVVRDD